MVTIIIVLTLSIRLLGVDDVKKINELCEQFSLVNKHRKIKNHMRLKGTARVHVLFKFD